MVFVIREFSLLKIDILFLPADYPSGGLPSLFSAGITVSFGGSLPLLIALCLGWGDFFSQFFLRITSGSEGKGSWEREHSCRMGSLLWVLYLNWEYSCGEVILNQMCLSIWQSSAPPPSFGSGALRCRGFADLHSSWIETHQSTCLCAMESSNPHWLRCLSSAHWDGWGGFADVCGGEEEATAVLLEGQRIPRTAGKVHLACCAGRVGAGTVASLEPPF